MVRQTVVDEIKRSGYDLLTIEEAAIIARRSEATIRRCISEGTIVAKKSRGGSVRIERQELQDYIDGKCR